MLGTRAAAPGESLMLDVSSPSTARRGRLPFSAAMAVVLSLTALVLTVQLRTEGTIRRTLGIPSPQLQEFGYRLRRAEAQRQTMEQEVAALRERVADMRRAAVGGQDGLRRLGEELDRLRTLGGFTALAGPGVRVELRDSDRGLGPGENPNDVLVHYTDLQAIVNELWAAGAEAVAINGERFTVGSSIQCVGTTILINRRRITPPFQIEAIGDPVALQTYLARPEGMVAYLRAFGFPASLAPARDMIIAAYRGPLPVASVRPSR